MFKKFLIKNTNPNKAGIFDSRFFWGVGGVEINLTPVLAPFIFQEELL